MHSEHPLEPPKEEKHAPEGVLELTKFPGANKICWTNQIFLD